MEMSQYKQDLEILKQAKQKELANLDSKLNSFEEDGLLKKYMEILADIRKDGLTKECLLKQEIVFTKKNRMLEPEEGS